MSALTRRARMAALASALVLLAGCSSQGEQAADALCDDWQWDSSQSDDTNTSNVRLVMNRYDYDELPIEIIEDARAQCPGNFAEYDTYMSGLGGDSAGSAEPSSPGPDVAAGAEAGSDTSVADSLAGRGVDDDTVRALGTMATLSGYGLSKDTPLPFEQAQNTAAVMIERCDDVANGGATWPELIAEDVSDGAPTSDAEQMNSYLRDVFCPNLS